MSDQGALELASEIAAFLEGKDSVLVGAALADVVGQWLMAYPETKRPVALKAFTNAVRKIAVAEAEMRKAEG